MHRSLRNWMRHAPRLVALAVLTSSAPAIACQYEFAPEPIGGPSAKFLAGKMAAAATYVDVAIAEGVSDIRAPDGTVTPWAKGISFRVIDRWKGASTDRFLLFGSLAGASDSAGWTLAHWVDDQGRVEPHEGVREAVVLPPVGMTSCDPPALAAKLGRTYVILREADGRLLGAVQYHPNSPPRRGTPIAEIALWPDHEWARQLSYLRDRPAAGGGAPPNGPPASQDAVVYFRRPLAPAAVSQLLQRARAIPYGVTLIRGAVTSEYRLGTGIAWPGIVEDAARWLQRTATSREVIAEQARVVVDAYAVRDLVNDGAKQAHARSVLALAEAPPESGSPLIVAVSVAALPPVQRTLANEPDVAQVIPATMVRDRVATRPPPAAEIAISSPPADMVALHRRLTKYAGRTMSPSAIEGRWRMTGGDSTVLREQLFVLALSGGRAVATLPCARSEGTYAFAGQVLELSLPKPSTAACPKSESYWYPEYFLDPNNGPLTARRVGDKLDLIGQSGTYHFVRDGEN